MNNDVIQRQSKVLPFTTHDGELLSYRHWSAIDSDGSDVTETHRPKNAIVLFHRGHEHGGRMAHLVSELDLPDYDFFAWDARGHGLSSGERGACPSFSHAVSDVDAFMKHIEQTHQIEMLDMTLIAQSVGAVLVSAWVHDFSPNIRAMILASPAFKIKLYVPFARAGLKLLHSLKGDFFINSYVKAKFLSHDPHTIESFDSDPLISRAISVNMLLGLYDAAKRVVADAQAINIPTQLFISGSDFVVHKAPQKEFFSGLSSHVKEQHILPGFYHDTLGELKRTSVITSIRRFVIQNEVLVNLPSYLDADKAGYSCAEKEILSMPLPKRSLRTYYWQSMQVMMKLGAKLSNGIKLGSQVGFDSGSMLDYVYRNEPSGSWILGRFIDKQYLNSLGWRGIRQRKKNLKLLLQKTIQQLNQQQTSVRILDVAAGHGRYVLEAIEEQRDSVDSILLRDYSDINVTDGRRLIEEKQLTQIAQFVKGDAFDREDLASLTLKPTVAIVSGLYELFSDNQMVINSLLGISEALENGGYLIYTNQPWHPQLELIARTLASHKDGQPWVMRRRSQTEMDQLVAYVGFEKIEQRIDQWGIFTVSVAKKCQNHETIKM